MSKALHDDPKWLRERYYRDRLTTGEMGELAGVSATTIRRYMEKHGIDRVPMGPKVTPPTMWTSVHGYEIVEPDDRLRVARLLAVAEYGFDAVRGMEVHHKNGIPWDDRPENIELLAKAEHARHHAEQTEFWKHREDIHG